MDDTFTAAEVSLAFTAVSTLLAKLMLSTPFVTDAKPAAADEVERPVTALTIPADEIPGRVDNYPNELRGPYPADNTVLIVADVPVNEPPTPVTWLNAMPVGRSNDSTVVSTVAVTGVPVND